MTTHSLPHRPENQASNYYLSPPGFRPFPVSALPEPCRSIVEEMAAAIGCDTSFIGTPMLATMAGMIGNRRACLVRRGWIEPCVIWSMIVAESGDRKSPAIDAVTRPAHAAQLEMMAEYNDAVKQFNREAGGHDADLAHWKHSGRKTGEPQPEPPDNPICKRLVVSDTTVEALSVVLEENPNGVLLVRDELAGMLRSFDQYKGGKGSDCQNWLLIHGARTIIIDRKGSTPSARRTIIIPRAAVSVTGGVQPAILQQVLMGNGREHITDGLAARFLMAYPPQKLKRWTDAEISAEAERDLTSVYTGLRELEPGADETGEQAPVTLPFTKSGKAAWIEFYNDHADEQSRLTGDLAAAWSKLEGGAARIALVIHCVRQVWNDPTLESIRAIDGASVRAAVELVSWFCNEALRIYGYFHETDEERETRELVEWIERHGGVVTPRQVQQGWRRYKADVADAERALIELAAAGKGHWLHVPPGDRGGRPTRKFRLLLPSTVYETPLNPEKNGGSVDVDTVDDGDRGPEDGVNRALSEAAFEDEEAA